MSFRQWRTVGGTSQLLELLTLDFIAAGQRSRNALLCRKCCHRKYNYLSTHLSTKSSLPVLLSPWIFNSSRTQRSSTCTLSRSSHFKSRRRPECQSSLRTLTPAEFMQKSTLFSALNSPTKKEFTERRIMGFSREQMFAVVSDVENYSKFLPWCESSVVTERNSAFIEANLVIGMKPVTESYTSRVFLRKPSLIIAESDKGAHFKQMLTKWHFSPGLKTVPQSTIVDFYVSLEFRSSLHANIANVFFNEVVKAMAGAFYDEAKRRYGKESVPSRKIAVVKNDDEDKTQF